MFHSTQSTFNVCWAIFNSYQSGITVAWFSLVCLISGCETPLYYKCEGVVTHDGKPVPNLQINFSPVIVDSVRSPIGITDAEGKFEMTTARFHGVPPGEYKVFVEDPAAADGRRSSKEEGYLYVISRYCELNSDIKYQSNKHRIDFELKLDTREAPGKTIENVEEPQTNKPEDKAELPR